MHNITKSRKVFEGSLIDLRIDEIESSEGIKSTREIVEHPGSAAVVPLTASNEVVLVRQFRSPVNNMLIEIPAGILESGEKKKECALRELKEETGITAEKMEHLISFYPTPGFCNEVIHLFLARSLKRGTARPDNDEELELLEIPLRKASEMINNGEITDAKTVIGIREAELIVK